MAASAPNYTTNGFQSPTTPGGNIDWGNIIGDVGTGLGLYSQGRAQSSSSDLARYYAMQTGNFGPFNFGNGTGFGASYDPRTGQAGITNGPLSRAYNSNAKTAGSAADAAGMFGGNAGAANYYQNLGLNSAGTGLGQFNQYGPGSTANAAFLGAAGAAGEAGQSNQDIMKQYLDSMNALQGPQNQRNFDMLQSSLFGNGQLGASSGALQTEAFGRGLANQNAMNTLNAEQLGLQGRQVAANTAGTLGGLGQGLLTSAFNNFGNIAGLGPSLQGGYLQNSGLGINNTSGITSQGLGMFGAGLQGQLANNQAFARAGQLASGNANSPAQQSPFGQIAAGLFSQPGVGNGIAGLLSKIPGLSGIFGGGGGGGGGSAGTAGFGDYGFGGNIMPDFGTGGGYGGLSGFGMGSPTSSDFGNYGLSTSGYNWGGGFNPAGGEAASNPESTNEAAVAGFKAPPGSSPFGDTGGVFGTGQTGGQLLGDLGGAANIGLGLSHGGLSGGLQAAGGAATVGRNLGLLGSYGKTIGAGLGAAGGLAGLYNAFQTGGGRGVVSGITSSAQLLQALQALTGTGTATAAGAGGASSAAGASSGLAGGLAGAAGGFLAAAPMMIGAHQRDFTPNGAWWDRINKGLAAGPGSVNSYGASTNHQFGSSDMQKWMNYNTSKSAIENYYGANGDYNSANIPVAEQKLLASYGLTPGGGNGVGKLATTLAKAMGLPMTTIGSNEQRHT